MRSAGYFASFTLASWLILSCANGTIILAQEGDTQPMQHSLQDSSATVVDLRIRATVPEGSGDVFLAGNVDPLGNWKPNGLLMNGEGTTREATIQVPNGTAVEFKLTQGTWNTEAINSDFTVPPNHTITVSAQSTVEVNVVQFRSSLLDVPYPDPARYQPDIDVYLEQDKDQAPSPGGVLAIGSSNMLHWQATIQQDLAPLTIVPRAFGGSMMNDYGYFFDSIVLPYQPRAILLYGGSNDLAHGVFPKTVEAKFLAFVEQIHQAMPSTRVYVLSPIPSPSREEFRERTDELGERLRKVCEADSRLTFIDVSSPLLDESGKAKSEYFVEDQLHLNALGYQVWTETVRPVLLAAELPLESLSTP